MKPSFKMIIAVLTLLTFTTVTKAETSQSIEAWAKRTAAVTAQVEAQKAYEAKEATRANFEKAVAELKASCQAGPSRDLQSKMYAAHQAITQLTYSVGMDSSAGKNLTTIAKFLYQTISSAGLDNLSKLMPACQVIQ